MVAVATVCIVALFTDSDPVTFVTSLIGVTYVLGIAFSSRWANLFGAVLAVLFGYFSYQQGFFGNALICFAYSLPVSLWGFYLWNRNSKNGILVERRNLSKDSRTKLALGTVAAIGVSCGFSFYMGSNLWYLDGFSAILPIIGTYLLARMYAEQWYYWLGYNTLEVIMWTLVMSSTPEMLGILVMRILFLINSIFGFVIWRK